MCSNPVNRIFINLSYNRTREFHETLIILNTSMESTTFDAVLGLEEQFYNDGHRQGLEDGVKAGRIEGRTFGLEKGFEKYVESGRLHGKSIIWANRIPKRAERTPSLKEELGPSSVGTNSRDESPSARRMIPQLPDNARLTKHVKVLYALAESESLSTENTEEAVSDFDDRLKRAHAKAKIIERMAGETKGEADGLGNASGTRDGSIEDVNSLNARR